MSDCMHEPASLYELFEDGMALLHSNREQLLANFDYCRVSEERRLHGYLAENLVPQVLEAINFGIPGGQDISHYFLDFVNIFVKYFAKPCSFQR